jgi:hypothetical protein
VRCHQDAPVANRPGRPRIEVADVFRAHGETYRQSHALPRDQLEVMRDIEICRTEALGGHLDVCPDCGHKQPAYNSCRNRHCPKCQSLEQARWLERRLCRILPCHYFHVVFTMPAALRPLVRANRKLLFNLLFASASRTLLDLGDDPKRLGARLGVTAVLHTWTRQLTFHPHLHCIVTGGGLAPAGDAWVPCSRRFIFPVRVLADLFRGKLLDGLRRLRRGGALLYTDGAASLVDDDAFDQWLDRLYSSPWVVYAKRPFAGVQHVFRYLGRYTHRVGISNHRIQAFDEHGVRFATKDGKAVTLNPFEFIRRFLEHVLPPGFTKIRHFGLFAAGNVNTKLEKARRLLAPPPNVDADASQASTQSDGDAPVPAPGLAESWQENLLRLTGVDPRLCPKCGGVLIRCPLPSQRPSYTDTS